MQVFANPLRFDANGDFWAPTTDEEALLAEVELLVMTRKRTRKIPGEIVWDQEFGTLVDYLRHSRETSDPTEVAAELQEAFKRYLGEGRIQVTSVSAEDGAMRIHLQYGATRTATLTVPFDSW